MGTWAIPHTHEKAGRMETAMESPITAGRAVIDLYDIVGNDTLWDMLDDVAQADPGADVRPLLAAHLEDMSRWWVSPDVTKAWEPGVREKLAFMADRFENEALPGFRRITVLDEAAAVTAYLEGYLAKLEEGNRDMTARRIAPGAYAVWDAYDNRIYRVECRYGLVSEAPDANRETLRETLFPSTAPRPN